MRLESTNSAKILRALWELLAKRNTHPLVAQLGGHKSGVSRGHLVESASVREKLTLKRAELWGGERKSQTHNTT